VDSQYGNVTSTALDTAILMWLFEMRYRTNHFNRGSLYTFVLKD